MKFFKNGINYLLIVLLVIGQFAFLTPQIANAANDEISASVSINGQNGEILAETDINFTNGATAYDVLEQVTKANNIQVEYVDDPSYGKYIAAINGEEAISPDFWSFLVNEKFAETGISTHVVKDGEHLAFNFTQGTPSTSIKVIGKNNEEILNESYVPMPNEITALELLQNLTTQKNIELTITETDYGKMITSINNLAMEGNSYWGFYVNGQYASEGAATYKVNHLDKIVFKYETYVPPTEGSDNGNTSGSENVKLETINKSLDSAFNFLSTDKLDVWSVISLAQNGKSLPKSFIDSIRKTVSEKQGNFRKITDTEKYVLAILVYGEDPSNFEGYNLLEKIYNGEVTKQGTNGVAYGLIALNAANKTIPDDAKWTEDALVQKLLDSQNDDGGWPLYFEKASETDITAMIMTALSSHQNQPEVSTALDKAKSYLKGNIESGKVNNSNSVAQVIIALSSLKIDLNSFSEKNILSELLSYQTEDGGFAIAKGGKSDIKATSDALLALSAYKLSLNSQYVYEFDTLKPQISKEVKNTSEQEQEHELPNTASNMYNLLLIGFALISVAFILRYRLQRK